MTRLGSSTIPANTNDTNNVINFETVSGQCVNCEQKLNLIYSGNEADCMIGAGVVAFTSFVRNAETRVVVGDALEEIYSILNVPKEDESGVSSFDDNNYALCVDCCLIFAQLYGLLQTFESRRKTDGFLQTCLRHALRCRDEPKS